jgi:hypothetical protein
MLSFITNTMSATVTVDFTTDLSSLLVGLMGLTEKQKSISCISILLSSYPLS